MAAGIKGTQTLAGIRESRQRLQPQKLEIGTTKTVIPAKDSTGSVGQSFGRMIGGGDPTLRGLEASSMRLADAAAAREMRAEEAKFSRERGTELLDQEKADRQSRIARLEQELSQVSSSQPKTPAEQAEKNRKIARINDAISLEKSEISNLGIREQYESLNRRSQLGLM